MKTLVATIALLFITLASVSQTNTFNKLYDIVDSQDIAHQVVPTGNGYLVWASSTNLTDRHKALTISKLDKCGNLIGSSSTSWVNTKISIAKAKKVNNNLTVGVGNYKPWNPTWDEEYAFAKAIDSNGNNKWSITMPMGSMPYSSLNDVTVISENKILLTGFEFNSMGISILYITVDTLGNIIDNQTLMPEISSFDEVFFFRGLESIYNDGIITTLCEYQSLGSFSGGHTPFLLSIDTAYNILSKTYFEWEYTYPHSLTGSIIQLPNNEKIVMFLNRYNRSNIYRLDSLNNVIWYQHYSENRNDYHINSIALMNDSTILAVGNGYPFFGNTQNIVGKLITIDINTGLADWIENIHYTDNYIPLPTYTCDLRKTMDGGFIIAGGSHIDNDSIMKVWALKLDENLQLDSNSCHNQTITSIEAQNELDNNQIRVFPNPCSDYIKVNGAKKSMLRIYGMNGIEILKQELDDETNSINVSTLPQGTYIIRLNDSGGKYITHKKVVVIR